jgi:hypothetical protein
MATETWNNILKKKIEENGEKLMQDHTEPLYLYILEKLDNSNSTTLKSAFKTLAFTNKKCKIERLPYDINVLGAKCVQGLKIEGSCDAQTANDIIEFLLKRCTDPEVVKGLTELRPLK